MNLILYAIPVFMVLLLAEVMFDRYRETGYYRLDDAIASLSSGLLSQTMGFATRFIGTLGWMERVFVTPMNHRVHHAINDPYIDRNFGGVFILWDRLRLWVMPTGWRPPDVEETHPLPRCLPETQRKFDLRPVGRPIQVVVLVTHIALMGFTVWFLLDGVTLTFSLALLYAGCLLHERSSVTLQREDRAT